VAIEIIDLHAGYRRGDFVLRGVNMVIQGDAVILGPNGSGKTTLLRAITGITVSKKGRILIDGLEDAYIGGRYFIRRYNLREYEESRRFVEEVFKCIGISNT